MMSKLFAGFVLGVIFLLPAARPADAAAAQAGEVLALFGDSVIANTGQPTPLKVGDPVHVGDAIDVGQAAKLKLRMIDGSVIAAGSGSHLTIDSYSSDSTNRDVKLSLAAGLLRAVVAKAGSSSSFEVNTATGVAAVRSTDWFIATKRDSTQVGVLSGVVDLSSRATGRDVRIPARWGARVEAGMDPVPPRVWQKSEFEDVIERTDLN
jgi:hypothetical protein